MIRKSSLTALLVFFSFVLLSGQTEYLPKKVYRAFRVESAPDIDGVFDDVAWQEGEWAGDFVQHQPYADKPPSQPTEFKLAYDDMNIYVAIRALDSAPDSISSRMSRRDNADGDMVLIAFDSYHDLRTAFAFGVSSAGVRFDMIMTNNGQEEDPSWDPIWQAKAEIHDWGWGAEMKIPFTQLRFKKNSQEVWGFEVARQLFRKQEMSFWHPIPRTAPGMVHAFGELDGLQEIQPRKQLDLMPYGVTSLKTYEAVEGDPFNDGTDPGYNIGLDGKIGVTNNLTLDFTINPDFGQVEADPSEVNLSAYETYFEEKRPFFIEGSSITSFGVGLGGGGLGNDNLFYSRRIGRTPHGFPSVEDGEHYKIPIFTRILGAAKLTGKTEGGLSVGVLEAVTNETRATVENAGEERKEIVEPLTNYSLARVQKDFNKGNTIIGAATTSTIRRLDGTDMDYLHRNATTAGLDVTQFFKERNYRLEAALYLSNVQGSEQAIAITQRSSARYFQRPDADHLEYDNTRTSLSGMGGKLTFGKIGGKWNFLYLGMFKSPGIELNDMGYMQQADFIVNVLWTGYNFIEPFSIFRSLNLWTEFVSASNFGGELITLAHDANVRASFKNYWSGNIMSSFNFKQLSTGLLRGGPSMYLPNSVNFNYNINSDQRKNVYIGFNGNVGWGSEHYYVSSYYGLSLTVRPLNTLSISLRPSYSTLQHELQYVTRQSMNGEARYIFAHIDRRTLNMSIRINYNITPDLTIQYWGQPFIFSGEYSDFKMITDPKADAFTDRYHIYETEQITLNDGVYEIDEDRDDVVDYSFGSPDMTFDEWLSNLVVRWEFLPGSTAYLVWSQSRDFYTPDSEFQVWENMHNLYTDEKATNTFLLKVSYRFGLR